MESESYEEADNNTSVQDDADLFELAHAGARENRPYLTKLLELLKTRREERPKGSRLSQVVQKNMR